MEEQVCHWRPYNENFDRKYSYDCATILVGQTRNSVPGVTFVDKNVVELKSAKNQKARNRHFFANTHGFNFRPKTNTEADDAATVTDNVEINTEESAETPSGTIDVQEEILSEILSLADSTVSDEESVEETAEE